MTMTRYPDSWYQKRYNCTWEEFLHQRDCEYRYSQYALPVEMFHLHSVGEIVKQDYIRYVLCEKRMEHVPATIKHAIRCIEYTYSANGHVLLTTRHTLSYRFNKPSVFDARESSNAYVEIGREVPEQPVTDIKLLAVKLTDLGHMRWIVGSDPERLAGYSKLSMEEQFAGKTELKHELQVKEKRTDTGVWQMELDIGKGAY